MEKWDGRLHDSLASRASLSQQNTANSAGGVLGSVKQHRQVGLLRDNKRSDPHRSGSIHEKVECARQGVDQIQSVVWIRASVTSRLGVLFKYQLDQGAAASRREESHRSKCI